MFKATFFAVAFALASVGAPAVVAPNAEAKQTLIFCTYHSSCIQEVFADIVVIVFSQRRRITRRGKPTWWLEMLWTICKLKLCHFWADFVACFFLAGLVPMKWREKQRRVLECDPRT
ncbi:hypothetical protein FPV67DRAFT_1486161 [Lyophyllum atratum]|nr:hypothetical protein FPV67DRAFT_1486161 [Lyophyllum atratum]